MSRPSPAGEPPRLGFVGVGWIGGLRLEAIEATRAGRVAAICDTDEGRLGTLADRFPGASLHTDAFELIDLPDLDAVVLATPNALHAPHALHALERGLPLYVQKPLGLDYRETERVLDEARARDRLVTVDYSYRHLEGARLLCDWVEAGELGDVHFVEAVFHNAFGPDKTWCFDRRMSGGGALLDLGVHLLDLVFWMFGRAEPRKLAGWTRCVDGCPGIDQFAGLHFRLDPDLEVNVVSSWHAHAGKDCDFRFTLHGTRAGAELRSAAGSFYDFELVRRGGRSEQVVVRESREWMQRGIHAWIEGVRAGGRYDPEVESSLAIAEVVDRVYRGDGHAHPRASRPAARASSAPDQKEPVSPGWHT